MAITRFIRDDGVPIREIPGFRDWVLGAPRASVQPTPEWTDDHYASAARKKIRGMERFVARLDRWGTDLKRCSVLDIGCGAGIDTLLLALHPVRQIVGIDLAFPLMEAGENGDCTRRLAREMLRQLGITESLERLLARARVRFESMTAAEMNFPDATFDLVLSRAVLEHVAPLGGALAEMGRVAARGGLLWHTIDPYYWMKGCHKRGLVDVPWAHARLSPQEYRRYLTEREGAKAADRRCSHLSTLNQLGLDAWRTRIEETGYEVLQWREDTSPLAEAVLEAFPEAVETVRSGIDPRDLTRCSIRTWLRAPSA